MINYLEAILIIYHFFILGCVIINNKYYFKILTVLNFRQSENRLVTLIWFPDYSSLVAPLRGKYTLDDFCDPVKSESYCTS